MPTEALSKVGTFNILPAYSWDEPCEYARSGAELLSDIHAFLGRFIAYPTEHTRVAHTLWIAHTHCMEAWDSTPRIAFLSPEPGSGKSRCLGLRIAGSATSRSCERQR